MEGEIITIPWSRVFSTKEVNEGEGNIEIESNSYLIKTSKMNLLIDAGSKRIFDVLSEQEIKQIDAVLLTHAHADHIKQLQALQERFGFKIYLHLSDHALLTNSEYNDWKKVGLEGFTAEVDKIKLITDNQTLHLDNFDFQVIHTPGHTHGSVMYYCKKLNALFTGDMILGKYTWSYQFHEWNKEEKESSIKKIKTFLETLPKNTKVYPWHGERILLKRLLKINQKLKK